MVKPNNVLELFKLVPKIPSHVASTLMSATMATVARLYVPAPKWESFLLTNVDIATSSKRQQDLGL